jgi:hypothetical protein
MKTRVIPAQITTVEDKIAGNLNLTQIVLLMIPVFWLMIVYTLFFPQMQITMYKFPLIVMVLITCFALALRVKGKVVLNWLIILFKFNIRPKYYLFNKNDDFERVMNLPSLEKTKRKVLAKSSTKPEEKHILSGISFGDLAKLEHIVANPKISFSIRAKKGGLYVAFEQKQ